MHNVASHYQNFFSMCISLFLENLRVDRHLGVLPNHQMIAISLYMEKKDVTPNLETKGTMMGFLQTFLGR